MHQARQHVSVFQAEVVVRTKDVGRDHSRVASSILLIVASAKHQEPQRQLSLQNLAKRRVCTGSGRRSFSWRRNIRSLMGAAVPTGSSMQRKS